MADPQPSLELPDIPAILSTWLGNFTRQTSSAFTRMTLKDWIRMVIVIGGYVLLRPYFVKAGAKFQQKQFEKQQNKERQEAEAQLQAKAARTGMDPNELRASRKIDIPGLSSDSESEDDDVVAGGNTAEWGRKARIRQRKFIRNAMEEHERKLHDKATESDKDIEDLLED